MKAKFVNEDAHDDASQRLKSPEIDYMEIKEHEFFCEYCTFFKKDKSYCTHPKVLAYVNEHGCCNKFNPFPNNKVDSDNWKLNK